MPGCGPPENGKSRVISPISRGYLWVSYPQESLENTINTMGTLLGWYTQLSLDRMCINIPPQNAPRFVEYQTGPQICHNSYDVYSYIVHIQLVYKCMLKMYMYNVYIFIYTYVCFCHMFTNINLYTMIRLMVFSPDFWSINSSINVYSTCIS